MMIFKETYVNNKIMLKQEASSPTLETFHCNKHTRKVMNIKQVD